MQIKTFMVPIVNGDEFENQLNIFLRDNKVLVVDQQLGVYNGDSCWCFSVQYLARGKGQLKESGSQKRSKIDYKEVLGPVEFAQFSHFRKIRKEISLEEAIPAFAIFTDAQLAELSKIKEHTPTKWAEIKGVGPKTIEKYFQKFLMSTNIKDAKKDGKANEGDS